MNGSGHTYLAATTAITLAAATTDVTTGDAIIIGGATLVASLAGGALPDADLKWPLRLFASHRGVTHRAYTHLILTGLLYAALGEIARHNPDTAGWIALTQVPLTIGLLAGLVSHAVGDMMTPKGLCYLAPLYRRPIHVLPFRWRVVGDGPPHGRTDGRGSYQTYEAWHRPYAVTSNGYRYVAVSQEHALLAVTVLYAAIIYLTAIRPLT